MLGELESFRVGWGYVGSCILSARSCGGVCGKRRSSAVAVENRLLIQWLLHWGHLRDREAVRMPCPSHCLWPCGVFREMLNVEDIRKRSPGEHARERLCASLKHHAAVCLLSGWEGEAGRVGLSGHGWGNSL